MGMYDTINGYQVKAFYIEYSTLRSEFDDAIFGKTESDLTIWCMGGNLRNFSNGDEVPFQTYYYNFGKDFNIIDFDDFMLSEQIIHVIRDGKVVKTISFDDTDDEILKVPNYDYNGNKLKITSVNDLIKYTENQRKIIYAREHEKVEATRNYFDMARTIDIESEEYKKLEEEYKKENEENEKVIKPFIEKRMEFFIFDEEQKYHEFGGILNELFMYVNNMTKKETSFSPHQFLVSTISYKRFLEILENKDFLDKYLNDMNFTDDFKEKILIDIEVIKENIPKELAKIHKEEEIWEYDMKEIKKGRYDKLCKKYNVVLYEGYQIKEK